ncbi:Hypothetical predicted protein [Mytilus galloprovincialis]|uniref:Apple domain-containing protein n=1 Tax=Mytilus galloprovincialis TaxID=29158 RepID=A0A8B6GWR8_MYTGA|nr:Hypothetical predicted protein [Mytilus galloprovincialis]
MFIRCFSGSLDSSCSFTSVGRNTIGDCGDDNFDQIVGSFEHCTESCIVNPLCHGVSYKTSRSICRRYTCDQSTTDRNVEFFPLTCTAYRCFAHAHRNKTGDCPSYQTVNTTLKGCKEECIEDDSCRAASFNADTDECILHNCTTSNDTSLETQMHILKKCGYSICHYNHTGAGYGLCSPRTHYAKDLNACLKFCEESYDTQDFNCNAVAYPIIPILGPENCALFDCQLYGSSINQTTSDFYIRHCPEDTITSTSVMQRDEDKSTSKLTFTTILYDKVTTFAQGRTSFLPSSTRNTIGTQSSAGTELSTTNTGNAIYNPTGSSVLTSTDEISSTLDTITSTSLMQRDESTSKLTSTTKSYERVTTFAQERTSFLPTSTRNTIGTQSSVGTEVTELSTTNTGNAIYNPTGSSVLTSTDEISSTLGRTTAQVAMSTLLIEDTSYSNGVTYNVVTYNNSRATRNVCLCWCSISENETFAEFYERIIEPLKVNKKSLSSTIRKLTCANDDRPSAARVGYVGVITLLIVILTIVALDFSSIANKLITHLRQH